MSLIYWFLRLGAHLTKGEIGLLACIGIATVTLGAVLVIIYGLDGAKRVNRRIRQARDLRGLESGTLDGFNAAYIADMVDDFWLLDENGAIKEVDD
jgi:hypothetical protein